MWTVDNIHVKARLYECENRQRYLYDDYRVRSHLYAKMNVTGFASSFTNNCPESLETLSTPTSWGIDP
jgi:hypothetical protein